MPTPHTYHLWVLKPIAGAPSWCKHPVTSETLAELDAQMVYHSKNHIDIVLQYAIVLVHPVDIAATLTTYYFDSHARPMGFELPSHFIVSRVHVHWNRTQQAEAQAILDEAADPILARQLRS